MVDINDIKIQNIDHLGLVAGIVDTIGIVEIINNLIGIESGEKVTAGQAVKAMIINGLGFISKPLYMFPKFFESIPCEHLIGAGVKPEYLNDDKLGRVMDKLYSKGLDTIFLAITLNAVKKFDISLNTSHLDSSSIHVHGEYHQELPEIIFSQPELSDQGEPQIKSRQPIKINYGYSRDHRPDLKQFLIELVCTGDGDIPIFLKAASGNQADSSCFAKIAIDYKNQIKVDSLIVADCALYTEDNLKLMSEIKWLSRVPLKIKLAQELVANLPDSEFTKSKLVGYSWAAKEQTYGGIKQRWLVVESQERRESDLRKLSQKISKSATKLNSELGKLSQDRFACKADAVKALTHLSKSFKYHQIEPKEVREIRPDKLDKSQKKCYQILGSFTEDKSQIEQETNSAGRFIIATNVLAESEISNEAMLTEYKAQQSCERGFGFLKDPTFFADSVYLKSPERIESLAAIMGLGLLVYTLAQRQIRAALSAAKSTIKNQLGKATDRPTAKWIFQCFQAIHLVTFQQQQQVSNWSNEREFILTLLPEDCRRYYKFIT